MRLRVNFSDDDFQTGKSGYGGLILTSTRASLVTRSGVRHVDVWSSLVERDVSEAPPAGGFP